MYSLDSTFQIALPCFGLSLRKINGYEGFLLDFYSIGYSKMLSKGDEIIVLFEDDSKFRAKFSSNPVKEFVTTNFIEIDTQTLAKFVTASIKKIKISLLREGSYCVIGFPVPETPEKDGRLFKQYFTEEDGQIFFRYMCWWFYNEVKKFGFI